jgi:hypothetical protein
MNITLLTLTTPSRAPASIRLETGPPLAQRPAPRGKIASLRIGEWTEGQEFQVAIQHGHQVKSGRLSLYF